MRVAIAFFEKRGCVGVIGGLTHTATFASSKELVLQNPLAYTLGAVEGNYDSERHVPPKFERFEFGVPDIGTFSEVATVYELDKNNPIAKQYMEAVERFRQPGSDGTITVKI